MKTKIITVIGARPQFIKAASLSKYISTNRSDLDEIIIHTGQHFDSNMSDVFFDQLGIPQPKYNLKIGGGSHGQNTGRMIEEIEKIITSESASKVIVYGDTDSTLAGAIAASKLDVQLVHIEAGLRSWNRKMPEEINRIITDQIADLSFCSSKIGKLNLLNEGIDADKIKVVGDIMCDSVKLFEKHIKKPHITVPNQFILCTIHRAENTNDLNRLTKILETLSGLSEKFNLIIPIHPRLAKSPKLKILENSKISLIEPVGYLEMLWLIKNSKCVITDSGGLQKEAFFLKKPCLTIRTETEWIELTEIGVNILIEPELDQLYKAMDEVKIPNEDNQNIYGDGTTAVKIASYL